MLDDFAQGPRAKPWWNSHSNPGGLVSQPPHAAPWKNSENKREECLGLIAGGEEVQSENT